MIIQRWNVEILRGGKLFYLLPPLREQCVTLLPDELCQFIEIVDGLALCGSVIGLSRLSQRK